MTHNTAKVQVWFDSQCPLCIKEIAFMRRLDWLKRVDFVDIYTAQHCPLERSELLARFHAREASGPIVHGAAAFALLWRHLPLLMLLGHLARIPVLLSLLERAYLPFLNVRPRLQKYFASSS